MHAAHAHSDLSIHWTPKINMEHKDWADVSLFGNKNHNLMLISSESLEITSFQIPWSLIWNGSVVIPYTIVVFINIFVFFEIYIQIATANTSSRVKERSSSCAWIFTQPKQFSVLWRSLKNTEQVRIKNHTRKLQDMIHKNPMSLLYAHTVIFEKINKSFCSLAMFQ